MKRFLRLSALFLVVGLLTGCAAIRPGDDALVVRTQDVIDNSFTAWDAAMDIHAEHSTSESPAVYRAAEKVRTKFPPAHRALRDALHVYQAASVKDAARLRNTVLAFLDDIEALAEPGSKFVAAVRLIRIAFTSGGAK